MRIESIQGPPLVAPSAASAAFQVAVVQQKQFEESLERFSDKQEEVVEETTRTAERAEDVVEIGNLDKVVEASESENITKKTVPAPTETGAKVDVSI
jgi:hypothetical protein